MSTPVMRSEAGPGPRRMWQLLETCHAVAYFDPAARSAAEPLGIEGFWPNYVVLRAAPLGPVGPDLVRAVFYGFHRDRIAATLPAAWELTDPAAVLAARSGGVDAALGRLWGEDAADDPAVKRAADLAWEAAQAADCAGRPLGAANQALPRPDAAHLALWQAATTLREHRGDGHVAALTVRRIHPVTAMLLKVGAGESELDPLRLGRKWATLEWQAGEVHARDNGLIDDDGKLTADGAALHDAIEADTDNAAGGPWAHLGAGATAELEQLLLPLARRVVADGLLPEPNPIGLPLPGADTL
ncbi:MAG TPA: hypothetical protein VMZ00_18530 [Sporichthya sp.]|nr:hypothetical protein [Sporichthya sp.]